MLSVGNELMSSGIKILKIGEGGLFGEGEELYHGRPTIGLQGLESSVFSPISMF